MFEVLEIQQQGINQNSSNHLSMSKTPTEIWATIFSYLSSKDLAEVRLVCRYWHAVTQMTEFNDKRCLRITPANLPAIKDFCQLNVVGRRGCIVFTNVELMNVQYSEDLVYVLRLISRHVRHLHLLNAHILESINGNFARLRSLRLAGPYAVDQVCQLRFHSLHHLRSIDLLSWQPQVPNISPFVVAHVLKALNKEISVPQLQYFAVQCSTEVEHLVLVTLERHAPTLKALVLHFSNQVAASKKLMWIRAFQRCRRLIDLRMVGRVGSAFADLLVALHGVPLKSVCLSGSVDLTDDTLAIIAQQWRDSLNSLDIGHCGNVTDNGLHKLSAVVPRLRTLVAEYCCNISEAGLKQSFGRKWNTRMSTLNLEGTARLKSQGLNRLLLQLPMLQTLVLANCTHAVTDCMLTYVFMYLKHLKQLILSDAKHITDKVMVGEERCDGIKNLRHLEQLDLSGCNKLTDATLRKALCFTYLHRLELGYLPKITESGIQLLVAHCPAVQTLSLNSCCLIDDAAVLHIVRGLRRLRALNLNNCQLLTAQSVICLLEHGQLLRAVELEGNEDGNTGNYLAEMYSAERARRLDTDQPHNM